MRRSNRITNLNSSDSLKNETKDQLKLVAAILKKEESIRSEHELEVLKKCSQIVGEICKRQLNNKRHKEREQEVEDVSQDLLKKCKKLVSIIEHSNSLIIYSGAGISTAASIPDYRGPNGVWTLLKQGKQCRTSDLSLAEPTFTHMAITELYKRGYVKRVVSQNCDGLHLRSGLPRSVLSELHGNMYIEVCRSCHPRLEYLRLFDVTEKTAMRRHKTSRCCHHCHTPLHDTIIHFGEKSPFQSPYNWKQASSAANKADVILCLGTSLKVLKKYDCLWARHKPLAEQPKLVIINLQWTPKDKYAVLKINGRCDDVIMQVMNLMNIEVPKYDRCNDPLFHISTPLLPSERDSTTKILLSLPEGFVKKSQHQLRLKVEKRGTGKAGKCGRKRRQQLQQQNYNDDMYDYDDDEDDDDDGDLGGNDEKVCFNGHDDGDDGCFFNGASFKNVSDEEMTIKDSKDIDSKVVRRQPSRLAKVRHILNRNKNRHKQLNKKIDNIKVENNGGEENEDGTYDDDDDGKRVNKSAKKEIKLEDFFGNTACIMNDINNNNNNNNDNNHNNVKGLDNKCHNNSNEICFGSWCPTNDKTTSPDISIDALNNYSSLESVPTSCENLTLTTRSSSMQLNDINNDSATNVSEFFPSNVANNTLSTYFGDIDMSTTSTASHGLVVNHVYNKHYDTINGYHATFLNASQGGAIINCNSIFSNTDSDCYNNNNNNNNNNNDNNNNDNDNDISPIRSCHDNKKNSRKEKADVEEDIMSSEMLRNSSMMCSSLVDVNINSVSTSSITSLSTTTTTSATTSCQSTKMRNRKRRLRKQTDFNEINNNNDNNINNNDNHNNNYINNNDCYGSFVTVYNSNDCTNSDDTLSLSDLDGDDKMITSGDDDNDVDDDDSNNKDANNSSAMLNRNYKEKLKTTRRGKPKKLKKLTKESKIFKNNSKLLHLDHAYVNACYLKVLGETPDGTTPGWFGRGMYMKRFKKKKKKY